MNQKISFHIFLILSYVAFDWSSAAHVTLERPFDWLDGDNYDIYPTEDDNIGSLASSRCHPNPCENGGICHDTDEGTTCTCAHGFLGHRCQG